MTSRPVAKSTLACEAVISTGWHTGAWAVAVLLVAATAHAESGRFGVEATPVFAERVSLPAGVGAVVEVMDLAPAGADPVVHVQGADGGFLAGNDDLDETTRAARVVLAPEPEAREVWIVVRAYTAATAGTATLRVTPGRGEARAETILMPLVAC